MLPVDWSTATDEGRSLRVARRLVLGPKLVSKRCVSKAKVGEAVNASPPNVAVTRPPAWRAHDGARRIISPGAQKETHSVATRPVFAVDAASALRSWRFDVSPFSRWWCMSTARAVNDARTASRASRGVRNRAGLQIRVLVRDLTVG